MQIDVNEEIIYQIMKTELRESITGVKQDIKNLKKIRKR